VLCPKRLCKYASTNGKLYNWYAVNDPRGLAPKGWHIPTDGEWSKLITFFGGDSLASKKIYATGSNGFNGVLGGNRATNGRFTYVGSIGYWWTSTINDKDPKTAWTQNAGKTMVYKEAHSKTRGCSVRCIKN
jgi:uncharacterized protein (TIGR02145 family)